MDESAFNQAMAAGDMDALEKLLADYETIEIDDNLPETSTDSQAKPQPATPEEKVENTATTAAKEAGDPANTTTEEVQPEKVVLSKDGKHEIPYDVLEQARKRNSDLEQENQQLRAIREERDKLQKLLDKHQIDANAEDLDGLSADALSELAEDFPQVGNGIKHLMNEIERLKQMVSQSQATPDNKEVEARNAFTSIPELVEWQQNDRDRFDYAVGMDEKLMADPLWSAKPVRERYLEVARRTTEAFKPVQASTPTTNSKPASPSKEKVDTLPNSPSDIGNAIRDTATRGTPEYYANMSQSQIQNELARMSQSEYDKLMASIGF